MFSIFVIHLNSHQINECVCDWNVADWNVAGQHSKLRHSKIFSNVLENSSHIPGKTMEKKIITEDIEVIKTKYFHLIEECILRTDRLTSPNWFHSNICFFSKGHWICFSFSPGRKIGVVELHHQSGHYIVHCGPLRCSTYSLKSRFVQGPVENATWSPL